MQLITYTKNRTQILLYTNIPPSPLQHYVDLANPWKWLGYLLFLNETSMTREPIPIPDLSVNLT